MVYPIPTNPEPRFPDLAVARAADAAKRPSAEVKKMGFIYLTPRKAEREYCPLDWQRVGQFRAAEDMRSLGTPHSRAAHGASREAGGPREGAWESSI